VSRDLLLLCAALVIVTPSFAAAAEPVPAKPATVTGTVVLADLDLSTPRGAAEARRRLSIMSERLCRNLGDDRKVEDRENYVDCVHDTLAKTLERIQTPPSSLAKN
jgi:UrcA family protein